MGNFTFEDWGFLIITSAVILSSWILLGVMVVDSFARLILTKKRPQYRKWGVEGDIFHPPLNVFMVVSIGVVASAAYTFFLYMRGIFLLVTGDVKVDIHSDTFERAVLSLVLLALIGGLPRILKVSAIVEKVNKLEDLPAVFSERFAPSELLSIYEYLRHAPPLFWDEYANLSEIHVSEETNRKYRERAAPFIEGKLHTHNRWILTWMIITVGLAVVAAAVDFFA